MGSTWKLQDAKNRFSEVVNEAARSGPQIVTRRGREAAVVMSVEDYRRLVMQEVNLVDFLRTSPLCGIEIDIERSKNLGREIDL
ncbi:MAG: type II toxin-antitoxin system prevent-host-death family antitoxin [Acidobacteria bacterium]|nr:MAG: type II toxin-antitoxin system prevent-host-death family antitoxin [Acidobacteriota bacterium]